MISSSFRWGRRGVMCFIHRHGPLAPVTTATATPGRRAPASRLLDREFLAARFIHAVGQLNSVEPWARSRRVAAGDLCAVLQIVTTGFEPPRSSSGNSRRKDWIGTFTAPVMWP